MTLLGRLAFGGVRVWASSYETFRTAVRAAYHMSPNARNGTTISAIDKATTWALIGILSPRQGEHTPGIYTYWCVDPTRGD